MRLLTKHFPRPGCRKDPPNKVANFVVRTTTRGKGRKRRIEKTRQNDIKKENAVEIEERDRVREREGENDRVCLRSAMTGRVEGW